MLGPGRPRLWPGRPGGYAAAALSLTPARRRTDPVRAALSLAALAGIAACGPGEPRPASAPEGTGRVSAPAASRPDDPEAPGLTDLARLSRYVFREMQRRGECAPEAATSGRLDYTLELAVEGGRIASAKLVGVSAELGGFAAPLLPERWPRSLVDSVGCLEPHLQALRLATPPADGVYESHFSLGGAAARPPAPEGRAAQATLPEGLPDPAEPGLPDLQRVARHVFAEMHRVAGQCDLRNPFEERLGYAVEVEVRGGAIARAALTDARLERAGSTIPLTRDAWPEPLERFAGCFVPHLEGLVLDPPPADGVYRPDYAVRPER